MEGESGIDPIIPLFHCWTGTLFLYCWQSNLVLLNHFDRSLQQHCYIRHLRETTVKWWLMSQIKAQWGEECTPIKGNWPHFASTYYQSFDYIYKLMRIHNKFKTLRWSVDVLWLKREMTDRFPCYGNMTKKPQMKMGKVHFFSHCSTIQPRCNCSRDETMQNHRDALLSSSQFSKSY